MKFVLVFAALVSIGASQGFAQGGLPVRSDRFAGSTVNVQGLPPVVCWAPGQINASTSTEKTDTLTAGWWHQPNTDHSPRMIEVRVTRRPGQTPASFAAEFEELVRATADLFPPLGDNPSTMPAPPDGTLQAAWWHDMDGAGPLHPIKIYVTVEKKAGESSAETARRLAKEVEETSKVFPPNVPAPGGG